LTTETRAASSDIWPVELRLSEDRKRLSVVFDNGERHELSAEYLRVESPSAEVQGHGPSQKVTVGGKADVEVMKIEPVGNYAVRITFSDMHSTGIFSWPYLLKLGREHDEIWPAYLDRLREQNKSRTS
jgi:DUF971 family protein